MNIGYNGTLTVYVKNGKTTIQKRTYTNHGTSNLFKFFCYCLAGEYNAAKAYQPAKIKLFNERQYYETEGGIAPDFKSITVENPGSNLVSTNKTAKPIKAEKAELSTEVTDFNGYSLTLHYLIPFSYLTTDKINQACLYSALPDGDGDFLAYYLFTDEQGIRLEPIEITDENKLTYNLVIE